MFLELDEGAEIAQLEWAASFLKARANASITFAYNGGMHEWDKERALRGAADSLVAADKLQGRANMLGLMGRDYDPTDFHSDDDKDVE